MAYGADVNLPIITGDTPLYVATENNNADAIWAIGKLGTADTSRGANGEGTTTPLILAAYNGYTEAAEALIAIGAGVGRAANHGQDPVGVAREQGDRSKGVLQVLLLANQTQTDENKKKNDKNTKREKKQKNKDAAR